MTIDSGYDFRQTSGYVTDPSNCYFVAATTSYPTLLGGLNVGYISGPSSRDRSTSVDPRLAGIHFFGTGAGDRTFKIAGLTGKSIDIRLAAGDATSNNYVYWELWDGDPSSGGSLITSYAQTLISTGQFVDATGATRTSSADWVTNNAAYNHTFSNDILFWIIKNPSTGNVVATHIRVTETGGSTTYTDTTSLDAILKKQGILLTTSLNAILKKTQTLQASLDAIAKATLTKAIDLDSILSQAGIVKTSSLDAVLKQTIHLTLSLDSILTQTGSHTKSASLDAILKGTLSVTASLDAILKKAQTKTSSLDAVIILRSLLATSMDACMSKLGILLTTGFDARIQTITGSTGATLKNIGMLVKANRLGRRF
jgi:hypothetical protein